ncbi:MAG: lipoate--protein ligase [Cellulomonas sp. 73-92]|mgnify:CR=1 FL=1|uniref:lipoate--protein ligase family protein n=1 Tax=Cellulomonas sp. 73-92 TaxID=1895740 RepID=UPI00092BE6A6|nr:biotin/lipoate A/B protein ligase family protein [Cellulomonas sp. 73-92]OJV78986.1 MAG: lipoate--protein ligase [Cellulomonas sp. 73-92]
MHGAYKVPGGKLVVVDLEVSGGRLAGVVVSGDFFAEPDELLDVFVRALDGLPETSTVAQLTTALDERVAAELPGAQLIGATTRDVAIAVRRALGRSTSWADHEFTFLDPGVLPPAMHTALDQVLTEELAAGRRGPTFRFWEWDTPAVVIGSFQSLSNEVDLEAAERYGVRVVRRISGGGAMFMEAGNCITFSLVVPESLVDGLSYEESYAFLNQWVLGALADVEVQASLTGLNDIASPAGKIAGSAQKRLVGGAVLHHVTMAYDIDADKMNQVLRIGREKLSDKGTASSGKRVDPVRSQTRLPREDVITAFEAHFRGRYRTVDGELTADELARADRLRVEKFESPGWTARLP